MGGTGLRRSCKRNGPLDRNKEHEELPQRLATGIGGADLKAADSTESSSTTSRHHNIAARPSIGIAVLFPPISGLRTCMLQQDLAGFVLGSWIHEPKASWHLRG